MLQNCGYETDYDIEGSSMESNNVRKKHLFKTPVIGYKAFLDKQFAGSKDGQSDSNDIYRIDRFSNLHGPIRDGGILFRDSDTNSEQGDQEVILVYKSSEEEDCYKTIKSDFADDQLIFSNADTEFANDEYDLDDSDSNTMQLYD